MRNASHSLYNALMRSDFFPFWRRASRWLIAWRLAVFAAAAPLLAMGCAVLVLRATTPEFTAVMTVAPTARSGGAGAGLRVAGGTAMDGGKPASAMAEPGMADETLSDFARYLELLRALPSAEIFLRDSATMAALFPRQWRADIGGWGPPPGFWPSVKRFALTLAGRPTWTPPDAATLTDLLRRRIDVSQVGTGPMRRVTFRHADREFALSFLQRLATTAENRQKSEAARRALVQIDFIRIRLQRNLPNPQHALALAQMLADEERLLLALEVDLPYAADVVEPPHAAASPDWPDALLTIGAAGLAGFFGSVCVIGGVLRARRPNGENGPA